jgi:hypothetical protein
VKQCRTTRLTVGRGRTDERKRDEGINTRKSSKAVLSSGGVKFVVDERVVVK